MESHPDGIQHREEELSSYKITHNIPRFGNIARNKRLQDGAIIKRKSKQLFLPCVQGKVSHLTGHISSCDLQCFWFVVKVT